MTEIKKELGVFDESVNTFPEQQNNDIKQTTETTPEQKKEIPQSSKIQNIKSKLNSKIIKIIFVVFLILIICILVYVIYYLNKHRPNVDVDLLTQTKEAYAKLSNEHSTLKNKCKFLEQSNEQLKNENNELVGELNNSIMMYDEPTEENQKPKKFKEKKAEIYKAYSTSKNKTKQKKPKKQDLNEIVETKKNVENENKDENESEDLNEAVDSIIN